MAYPAGMYGELQRINDILARRMVNPPPMSKYPQDQNGLLQRMGDMLAAQIAADPATTYSHLQSDPSETWIVNHNLGRIPTIRVLSPGGVVMEGDVVHTSVNQAVISFSIPVAGTAFCT